MASERSHVDLETLVRLFYPSPDALGQFEAVSAADMPANYRGLLAHEHHMTVTVEAFHRCAVEVEVLASHVTQTHYARKILLRREPERQVVQFGIMRVDLRLLEPPVRREIEEQQTPLGHVLIRHGVLRSIHLASLWKVRPGSELQAHFAADPSAVTYGRTALIACNLQPAVELLEIVAPL